MGLFTYSFAGGGFILLGAWEAFLSSFEILNPSPSPSLQTQPPHSSITKTKAEPSSSWVTCLAISLFSVLFVLDSLVSLIDALHSKDHTGLALQLQTISIACLFLLYSMIGLLPRFTNVIPFPSSILNLLNLFAFVEVLLLFYLQRKDPSGIENRYFDLLLVPIVICAFSTVLELTTMKSNYARLTRAVGLILQGTWFVQMGFSFFSDLIAHGCSLHEKSRGNYTIKCKGDLEYHRGRAIATLQFNCHLAFLVCLAVAVYAFVCKNYGIRRDSMRYSPLGAEMQPMGGQVRFTLDDDDLDDDNEIKEDENVAMQNGILMVQEIAVNGHSSHL